MRRSLLAILLFAAVATVIAVVACGDTGFGPSYGLDGPRILAIRSEPVDLVPDGQTTLDALVYVPPGSPAPSFSWSWCASLGTTEQCATSADALNAALADAGASGVTVDYALGNAETAVFKYPIDPTIVTAACARRTNTTADAGDAGDDDGGDAGDAGDASTDDAGADAAATITGMGGLRCTGDAWTVYILLTVKVGDRTLTATRDITAYLTTPTTVNANPTIEGLAPFTSPVPALDAGDPAEDAAADEYAVADASAGAIVSSGLVLSALVPESASELYSNATTTTTTTDDAGTDAGDDDDASPPDGGGGPRDDGGGLQVNDAAAPDADAGNNNGPGGGGPRDMYEQLTLAWYVESGTLDSATTTLAAANEDDTNRDWSKLLLNRWSPPTGSPEFIVVIRDNRGGVGWIRQKATGR